MTSSPNWSAGQDNWLIFLEGMMTNCCWGSAQTGRLNTVKGVDQNSGVFISDRYAEITGSVWFRGVLPHTRNTEAPAQGHRQNQRQNSTACTITFLSLFQIMSKLPYSRMTNVIYYVYIRLKFKVLTGNMPAILVDVMQAKSFLCNPADKQNPKQALLGRASKSIRTV